MRAQTPPALRWGSTTLIAIAFMATTVVAHHGWIQYDDKVTLAISGTITAASYSNPHASIHVQSGGDKGQTWRAVLAPPARMRSRGLSQDVLQPGITVTIVGHPHRNHADEIRAERITIGDKTIGLR